MKIRNETVDWFQVHGNLVQRPDPHLIFNKVFACTLALFDPLYDTNMSAVEILMSCFSRQFVVNFVSEAQCTCTVHVHVH